MSRRVKVIIVCALLAGVHIAVPQPALSQIDAKRQEAAELRNRIAEQGRRLSLADEHFNQARLERQQLEAQASTTAKQVEAAEGRWALLKEQLNRRVRLMYMHPGAALDAWLSQRSLGDLARARKLGSAVITADNELISRTEEARRELLTRAGRLDSLRDAAQSKERELAQRRSEVSGAVSEQRELLSNVTGEIANLMEAERRRELAAAARQTAAGPGPAPTAPAGADDTTTGGGSTPPKVDPPEEPTGPPPPVKGGASKAVATAADQIGKPYEWGADGPDSFDCSGLTMYAWNAAGVSMPHSSQAQFNSFPKVSKSQLRPGDLVFYGNPIHHVGIYEGGGVYINAPETGEFVRRNSIHRDDWAGAVRP